MLKFRKIILKAVFVFLLMTVPFFCVTNIYAASQKNIFSYSYGSGSKRSSDFDLDGDGNKEQIELRENLLSDYNGEAELFINKKKMLVMETGDPVALYIDYFKMNGSNIFIRIYGTSYNGYTYSNCIYRYNAAAGKLAKELDLRKLMASACVMNRTRTKVTASAIKETYYSNFGGNIGTVEWTNTYVLKNGKLTQKSDTVKAKSLNASIYKNYKTAPGYSKEYYNLFKKNKFKAAGSVKLYSGSSSKKVSYTARKGDVLTLKQIKHVGKKWYVQFSMGKKKGWMKIKSSSGTGSFYGVEYCQYA